MSLSKPSTSVIGNRPKGKIIHSQERAMIFNVYTYFKELSSEKVRAKTEFSKCQELTARACNVSVSTVSRILKQCKQSNIEIGVPIFKSPGKHSRKQKQITCLDDFKKDVLRRTIFEMYDRGEYPTIKKLVYIMSEKIEYEGSTTSMGLILKNLGFKYKRTNDGRKFLLERGDIVGSRIRFLRTMHDLRASGDTRPIFYLDETWVNQNHSRKDIWQDSTGKGGLKVPIGKGNRLIICHAGSAKTGFLQESKWVFRSQPQNRNLDYHSEMNADSFKYWFLNRFINLLEEGSIIVMDNASYHSKVINKLPCTNSRKQEIQEWLQNNNISYQPYETKPELLQKVNQFRTQEKRYELDEIALERGHTVIRLPPYHCQYNPIELIWAKVKGEVADQNSTFRLADVERLIHQSLDNVTVQDWVSRVAHTENLQEEDFRKEVARDSVVQNLTINLQDSDSDVSDQDMDEEDEEDEDEELAIPLPE